MTVKREFLGTEPFVDTILTPLIRLEKLPELTTVRPLYTSAVDGVYHQVFNHDPKSEGDWAMLSLITLSDEVGDTRRVYEDHRKRLTSRHWVAYCFRDKELYVVKDDPEKPGWKIYQRLKNVISTSSMSLHDFADIAQYRAILHSIAVYFLDNFQDTFHSFFYRTLPYTEDNCGYDLLQKWENRIPADYERFHDHVSSASFVHIMSYSRFSEEKKLIVRRPYVEDPIEPEDVEDKVFSKELYLKINDKDTGARLRVLRELAGLTQGEVSGKTGKTQAQISKIESGESEPGIKLLLMMSELYGCSLDLLTGDLVAEMVGKRIWIGDLSKGHRTYVEYKRHSVIGYDPVARIIFVSPSESRIEVQTKLVNGGVEAEVYSPDGRSYEDVSAYEVRDSIIGTVPGTSLADLRNGDDILFIPGRCAITFVESTGVEGYVGHLSKPQMKDPRLKGFKFFGRHGELVWSNE